MPSTHLDTIILRHNRVAVMQVVFIDIVKYSKRRSQSQIAVIDAFTDCLRLALTRLATTHRAYLQANPINFQEDVITLPTGDGAALCFSFEGLHSLPLDFSTTLLAAIAEHNEAQDCSKFVGQDWCNCHSAFSVRIGISEGKAILFKDINGNYNVAGDAVNMAARVMGLADASQVMFTDFAYEQLIDLVDDPNLADHFREFPNVTLKHGLRVSVYQYIDASKPGLDPGLPEDLSLQAELQATVERMQRLGMPAFPEGGDSKTLRTLVTQLGAMEAGLQAIFGDADRAIDIGEARPQEENAGE